MASVNSTVTIRLPRGHVSDPQRGIADDADRLRETRRLAVEFAVPTRRRR